MHVESNAFQQMFAPLPVSRSSWPQLVMFGLEPDISLMDPRVALRLPEDDRRKNNTVFAGLDPAIHKHKALAHDMHIESNAFQQMFAPLPVSRTFVETRCCGQAGYSLSCSAFVFITVMFGLVPDIQVYASR